MYNIKEAEEGYVYRSTKTYGHERGFSCAFRQHRAESHCHYLHGYALAFKFIFECTSLDVRNWVVDFGSLKSLKGWLEKMFDHTTLVAEDDPLRADFELMHTKGLIDMRIVPSTGCESTARYVFDFTTTWLIDNGYQHISLHSVEVAEHSGNSAIYGTYGHEHGHETGITS